MAKAKVAAEVGAAEIESAKVPKKRADYVKPGSVRKPASKAEVEATVGGTHYDGKRITRRRGNDSGDKEEGGAAEFHRRMDEKMEDEAPIGPHEVNKIAAKESPKTVPEEDRRRAVLSKEVGIDLWPRDAGSPALLEQA